MGKYEELWRIAWTLLVLLVAMVAVFSVAQSNHVVVFNGTWIDLATLALASATVVLTAVAILVAFGALWGYREMRAAVESAAAKRAEDVAREVAVVAATQVATDLTPRVVEARLAQEHPDGDGGADLVSAFSKANVDRDAGQ